jgi:sugar/nucleoside kinase (ribokinase family)
MCLGEPRVDMICEQPVTRLAQADTFVPHLGGPVASVALMAARAGATIALVGAVGDDEWGSWLRDQLRSAGVGLERFRALPDTQTPLALTTVDPEGEPTERLYGDTSTESIVRALEGEVADAVATSSALFISSDTLVGANERALTMRAREHAAALAKPVIFDPNLRLHRWRSRADAAASANACVPGALLVRCNAPEARLMTGEDDLERAALALRKAGARNVVITDGAAGAMLRGKIKLDVDGAPARVISTVGAGDALTATLIARLEATGFYEPAIGAALREATTAAAAACERWGACD